MSSLPLVIVNPASAGGATGRAWPATASEVRALFGAFGCIFTERPGDATVIAEREARAGRELIVACGGDGTISEVANGILLSGVDAELGVLPSGTGGDFRRTLGLPTDARGAARKLKEGSARRIDAGLVTFANESGETESRHFVNVASFGMGAEVVGRVNEKNRSAKSAAMNALGLGGRAAYAAAALRTTLTYANPTVELSLDEGESFRLVVTMLCVANARYFGGGMKIAPSAKLDDGLFDVVAVGDLSAPAVIANAYRLYLGTHLRMREVRHAHAKKITARAVGDEPVALEIDGDLAGRLPATFEILPNALRVRC